MSDPEADGPLRVEPCPRGPLLVRGARHWTDDDGIERAITRPVVALCRCEKSQRPPWCDGTHKFIVAQGLDPVRCSNASTTLEQAAIS